MPGPRASLLEKWAKQNLDLRQMSVQAVVKLNRRRTAPGCDAAIYAGAPTEIAVASATASEHKLLARGASCGARSLRGHLPAPGRTLVTTEFCQRDWS